MKETTKSEKEEENKIERSKFNVDKNTLKRTYDGIVFDSVLEMKFYRDVVLPKLESGEIQGYELQRPYILIEGFVHNGKKINPITYVADFVLKYDGREEVIDTKGMPDSVAILKRKLFYWKFPDVDYKWVCYSKIDGGWCDYEEVKKNRAARKRAKKKAAQETKSKE